MENRVYIIGAGTIGCALAVFLRQQGREVLLVRASQQVSPHDEVMEVVLREGGNIRETVGVMALDNVGRFDGLIIITVKAFANPAIAAKLATKAGSSPIVILQNGLGVEDAFIAQGFSDLYRCVLFATSQFDAQGRIVFKPVMASPVGAVRGGESLSAIVEFLQTPIFPFVSHPDIKQIVWKKTIANCVFNSVCPLLGVDNGIFHRDEAALAIAKEMIGECLSVARLEGIQLSAEEVVENLLQISRLSDGQFISTLQDINQGRPTEIDSLNMAVARIAAERGQGFLTPVTRALGELIRLKSGGR